MECDAHCPYCGETVTLWIDTDAGPSGGGSTGPTRGGRGAQRYVEDCSVCCRPCEVLVAIDDDGYASAELSRLDD